MEEKNNYNALELPTQEYLLEALNYNPETGILTWKKRPLHHFRSPRGINSWNSRYPGKNISSVNRAGYIRLDLNYTGYMAHRIIWKLYYGEEPDIIDHINGVVDDNRICNLRNVSVGKNNSNIHGLMITNTTGYTGVHFIKSSGSWVANISIDNIPIAIGRYYSPEEAALAYQLKYLELHGEDFYYAKEENRIILEELKLKVEEIKKNRTPVLKNDNTSGYRGVTYNKRAKKWKSNITKDKIKYNLGSFDILEEAALAYQLKCLELYGEEFYYKYNNSSLIEELKDKIRLIKEI